jgi:hypothetical protein
MVGAKERKDNAPPVLGGVVRVGGTGERRAKEDVDTGFFPVAGVLLAVVGLGLTKLRGRKRQFSSSEKGREEEQRTAHDSSIELRLQIGLSSM